MSLLIKAHKCKITVYLFFILFLSFLFIIFIKLIGTEWLRLCIEKERNPLISVDSAHIYKRDWIIDSLKNIERESFAEYKRRHNITQIMPDVPSTDEEESDDEAMDMLFL